MVIEAIINRTINLDIKYIKFALKKEMICSINYN